MVIMLRFYWYWILKLSSTNSPPLKLEGSFISNQIPEKFTLLRNLYNCSFQKIVALGWR